MSNFHTPPVNSALSHRKNNSHIAIWGKGPAGDNPQHSDPTHFSICGTCLIVFEFTTNFGFHPIPLGVWGWGRRKERKESEMKEIMGNQVYLISALGIPPYVDMQAVAVWSCSDATLHNPLIPFPILKRWFCWMYCTLGSNIFLLFNVQHLWLKMWYFEERCHFIMLLFALPVANIPKFWTGCFGLFVVPKILVYPCNL